jgi:coenzyme F420 hydrogenase subunit beta
MRGLRGRVSRADPHGDDPVNGRRPWSRPAPRAVPPPGPRSTLRRGASDWTTLARADEIDRDWGPVLATWEGWATDDEIRHRGSSGGAVSALAAFALDSGAADGVAHIAARDEDPA